MKSLLRTFSISALAAAGALALTATAHARPINVPPGCPQVIMPHGTYTVVLHSNTGSGDLTTAGTISGCGNYRILTFNDTSGTAHETRMDPTGEMTTGAITVDLDTIDSLPNSLTGNDTFVAHRGSDVFSGTMNLTFVKGNAPQPNLNGQWDVVSAWLAAQAYTPAQGNVAPPPAAPPVIRPSGNVTAPPGAGMKLPTH